MSAKTLPIEAPVDKPEQKFRPLLGVKLKQALNPENRNIPSFGLFQKTEHVYDIFTGTQNYLLRKKAIEATINPQMKEI